MSLPARRMPEPAGQVAPRRAPARAPTPTRRPAPLPDPQIVPRARRRHRVHLGFLAFTGVVVTLLVVGVVALNALVAQTAFHMREAEGRLADLHRIGVQLTDDAARLSSPGVVAAWARHHDMVTPAAGEVHILRVPGSGR